MLLLFFFYLCNQKCKLLVYIGRLIDCFARCVRFIIFVVFCAVVIAHIVTMVVVCCCILIVNMCLWTNEEEEEEKYNNNSEIQIKPNKSGFNVIQIHVFSSTIFFSNLFRFSHFQLLFSRETSTDITANQHYTHITLTHCSAKPCTHRSS